MSRPPILKVSPPTTNAAPSADLVNHPPHYTAGRIECLDAIESALTGETDAFAGFLRAQVIKYTWRAGKKQDAAEDAKKAVFYLQRYIQRQE